MKRFVIIIATLVVVAVATNASDFWSIADGIGVRSAYSKENAIYTNGDWAEDYLSILRTSTFSDMGKVIKGRSFVILALIRFDPLFSITEEISRERVSVVKALTQRSAVSRVTGQETWTLPATFFVKESDLVRVPSLKKGKLALFFCQWRYNADGDPWFFCDYIATEDGKASWDWR